MTASQAIADAPVLLRRDDGDVRTLSLNRPAARNGLSLELMAALQAELDAVRDAPSVKVVVIGATGPAFCAGHDLKEIRANPTREFYEQLFAACSRLMCAIVRLPQPVIARVQGPASAAGCQLLASADLAIAGQSARFATPGVSIGLFCSTPMVALSRNVATKHAMEMLLTGELTDASEAARIGLINRVVPDDRLDQAVYDLAEKIAAKSPVSLKVGKQAFYRQLELGLDEAYAYTSEVMTRNMLARDAKEGIDAFLEKRPPVWPGV